MAETPAKPKKLTLLPLAAATYFMVSGGAYGLEDLVACGYLVATAALVVTPVIWSLPTALMIGELASALPEEGGYYAWVRRALGPFWGIQEAWLSLVASVFDMAIYPTLFTLYLGKLVPSLGEGGAILVGALLIGACAAWNIRGAASVGGGAIALTVALLAPFVVFVALALVHPVVHGASTATAPPPPSPLLTGMLVAMWNYMGWDNASTIAGEVAEPQRTYPRAMLLTLGLVVATYIIPVVAAAIAGLDPSGWTAGAWVEAAQSVGGRWLAIALVIGGMVCGAGMFNALLLSYSALPLVLAEDGYLPKWMTLRHPRTGAPWVAIVVCSVAYTACLGIGFTRLVELDVMLYGASLLLEFVALVVLRVREPGLARPFKVRGGLVGAVLLGVGPLAMLVIALWQGREERLGPFSTLTFGALLIALGPVVWVARTRSPALAQVAVVMPSSES